MSRATPANTLWSKLGRSVSESTPVTRFNDNVLHHRFVTGGRRFTADLYARLLEICYPAILVTRGLRRAAKDAKGWWSAGKKEKRRIQAAGAAGGAAMLCLLPYGPVLLGAGVLSWLGWLGRDTSHKGADPEPAAHVARLQAVYNGLVPYLHDENDPDQHFKPGGKYRDAFKSWEFDEDDRLAAFQIDYSEYVRDGEAECRAKVERAIEGKVGRGNEFLYDWDEEGNHLHVRVLPPLPAGLSAQPWPVAEIEYVLGITDPDSAGRLVPVLLPEEPDAVPAPAPAAPAAGGLRAPADHEGWYTALVAPVVWRLGSPCPTPHLLVTGSPGSGRTTVLRSLIGQAVARGQRVAVIDVEQTEAYADLAGHSGVSGVIEDPERAVELIDWFGLECERRAERKRAAQEAVDSGDTSSSIPVIQEAAGDAGAQARPANAEPGGRPPLWLCVDGLPELLEAATRLGRPHLEDTLAVLARKARYAGVQLLVTSGQDQVLRLRPGLRAQLTVRVAMGAVEPAVSTTLFGGTLELGGSRLLPPGRGYVRVGNGPVIRLQTPYTPLGAVQPRPAAGGRVEAEAEKAAAEAPGKGVTAVASPAPSAG